MLPQIDLSTFPSQFLWASVSFTFLYFMLSKLILPKFTLIIGKRSSAVEEDINDAEELFEEVSLLKHNYEANVNAMKKEASLIKQEKLANFNSLHKQANMELDIELQKIVAQELSHIEQNLRLFKSDQASALINLSEFIIEKILHKKPDTLLLNECYRKIV